MLQKKHSKEFIHLSLIFRSRRNWRKLHNADITLTQNTQVQLSELLSRVDEMLEKIDHYNQDKEKKLEQARKTQEIEKLKGCTFTPDIHSKKRPPLPSGPILIRGLVRYISIHCCTNIPSRHLSRVEQAKRIEEEKKERYEQAFKPKYVPPPYQQFTVPEPFDLSTSTEKKQEKLNKIKVSDSIA